MLEAISTFFAGTIVQCLPALVALVAWGEAGGRIFRQFGTRMLWELAALVVVGIAILLYAMLTISADEGANILVIAVASICSVMAITAVTYGFPDHAPAKRVVINAGVALLALEGGLALGVLVCTLLWAPRA